MKNDDPLPSLARDFPRRRSLAQAGRGAASTADRPASWTQRREEIIATACRLMSEGGYRAISIERLAEALQVSKPTVYYYVDNKTGLWSALADLATGNAAHLRDTCSSINDPMQRLKALIHESVKISTGEMMWTSSLVDRDHLPDDMEPEIAHQLLDAAQSWFHTVIAVVRSSIAAGILPDLDPILTALNIIAMGAWCSKWYKRDYDVEPEEVERSILGLLLGASALDEDGSEEVKKPSRSRNQDQAGPTQQARSTQRKE
jgi:AcrR family transcriptional regulator